MSIKNTKHHIFMLFDNLKYPFEQMSIKNTKHDARSNY